MAEGPIIEGVAASTVSCQRAAEKRCRWHDRGGTARRGLRLGVFMRRPTCQGAVFLRFFLFFCLHSPSLRLIFIDLQFTTTKTKTGNLAAGAEIYANGRVRLQACGQGITVPVAAVCTSGR